MHGLRRRVDPRRRDAGDDVDAEVGQLARVGDHGQFRRRLGDDRRLRQRRALIGRVALLADQRQRAVIALLAQRDRGAGAGFARADDDDVAGPSCGYATRSSRRPPSTFTG